jgi:hypothetical protein
VVGAVLGLGPIRAKRTEKRLAAERAGKAKKHSKSFFGFEPRNHHSGGGKRAGETEVVKSRQSLRRQSRLTRIETASAGTVIAMPPGCSWART